MSEYDSTKTGDRQKAPRPKASGNHNVSRNYKDGVFRMLFNNPRNAAELYYAITGKTYKPEDIKIVTLSDALYANFKNDLAFRVRDRVVLLAEHQSTPNMNMPLRMAVYFGRIYESLINTTNLYANAIQKIPTPEFIVFYNGLGEYGASELKFSDAFLAKPLFGSMEITVPIVNINKSGNAAVLGRSKTLSGYAEFIAKVREFMEDGRQIGGAVEKAIEYCILKGFLADFLRRHGTEVSNMLTDEVTIEEIIEVNVREERKKTEAEKQRAEAVEKKKVEAEKKAETEKKKAEEMKLKYIRGMLSNNMPADVIMNITGLSSEELTVIAKGA